jgi:hypothetical protein
VQPQLQARQLRRCQRELLQGVVVQRGGSFGYRRGVHERQSIGRARRRPSRSTLPGAA